MGRPPMGRARRTSTVPRAPRSRSLAVAVVAMCLSASAVAVSPAFGDSIVRVEGLCSLPEAVAYADGSAEAGCAPGHAQGATTIVLPASAIPYTVTSTLSITAEAVIEGAGAASTAISGGGAVQVLSVGEHGRLTLRGLTVTEGLSGVSTAGCSGSGLSKICPAENGLDGGAIANAGTLVVQSSLIAKNRTSAGTLPTDLVAVCVTKPDCPAKAGESGGHGGDGGAIYNNGELTVEDSTISENEAGAGASGTGGVSGTGADASAGQEGGNGASGGSGGAIYNDSAGTATIVNSTISANTAGPAGNGGAGSSATSAAGKGGIAGSSGFGGEGGAILNGGTLTVTGSTISANETGAGGNGADGGLGSGGEANGQSTEGGTAGFGGALYSASAHTASLSDDTIAGNTTATGGIGGSGQSAGGGGAGGAIFNVGSGPVVLQFATIADNHAAGTDGAISTHGAGAVSEADSIVAANTASSSANCIPGRVSDNGHNLAFGENPCPGTDADPKLGALADNGGPTQTLALGAGSAAIGLVPANDCPLSVDQRGIARPQGAACAAGAYEPAPPQIAAVAGAATGATSATVTARVTANLRDTNVVVEYGTSSSYGSNTTAQDVGSGAGPTSFSAGLSGLAPSTTFHFAVVATSGDGTVTSADGTFTTPSPPVSAPPGTSSAPGAKTSACGPGSSGGACSSANPVVTARIAFAWSANRRFTHARKLVVSNVPSGGRVEVLCHGGGCPFGKRTFKPRAGRAALTGALRSSRLRPGATLTIEITAADHVGEVETFAVRRGRQPAVSRSCLAPGASRPTRCT